jgi:hypothetical protein
MCAVPGRVRVDVKADREGSMDLGNMGNMQQYLQGINFPAGKDEVASQAEGNGAPQDMVQKIKNAAMDKFNGPQDVMQAVGGK